MGYSDKKRISDFAPGDRVSFDGECGMEYFCTVAKPVCDPSTPGFVRVNIPGLGTLRVNPMFLDKIQD